MRFGSCECKLYINSVLKNVSWPWLSPLRGWGSLNMAFTGKFIYIIIKFYINFYIYIYKFLKDFYQRFFWWSIYSWLIKFLEIIIRYRFHGKIIRGHDQRLKVHLQMMHLDVKDYPKMKWKLQNLKASCVVS